ncbi:MAG: hypothetical protein ABIZ52_07130 [Candidatus Limnocylindrales bacterium]
MSRFIRAGLPALFGLLTIVYGVQSIADGFQAIGPTPVEVVRTGLVPLLIGAALVLAGLAIGHRSRLGYALGLSVTALMVVAGIGVVVAEVPYLQQGGLSASLGGGVMVLAGLWILFWLLYGRSMRGARASFAPTWQAGDRRMGIVLAALAIFSTGAYFGLGIVDANAVANESADQAEAAQLVIGTSIEVNVIDVRTSPGSEVGTSLPIEHLTLEISISGTTPYLLATAPRLCLTDVATFEDPAHKPDVFCWGAPDPSPAIAAAFADLTVSTDRRSFRLDLARGRSLCPFMAGVWNAALQLTPQLRATPGGGVGPVPESYTTWTHFTVASATAIPPDEAIGSCLAETVSP